MKRKINSLFLLTILFTGNAFAQKEKPNFSGVWDFDKKDSKVVFAGTEQPVSSKGTFNCSIKLIIEHNEPKLIVKEISLCEDTNKANKFLRTTETISKYFTDGRGEINNTSRNDPVESNTEWNGAKIIISIYETNTKNQKKKLFQIKELNLSKDKQKLVEKSVFKEPELPQVLESYTKKVFIISK